MPSRPSGPVPAFPAFPLLRSAERVNRAERAPCSVPQPLNQRTEHQRCNNRTAKTTALNAQKGELGGHNQIKHLNIIKNGGEKGDFSPFYLPRSTSEIAILGIRNKKSYVRIYARSFLLPIRSRLFARVKEIGGGEARPPRLPTSQRDSKMTKARYKNTMSGKELTYADRLTIETLYNTGSKIKDIAKYLKVSLPTVYREIARGKYLHKNHDWTYTEKYSADKSQQVHDFYITSRGKNLKLGNDYEFVKYLSKMINTPLKLLSRI